MHLGQDCGRRGIGRDLVCDIQLQERKERPFIQCRLWRKSFPLWTVRISRFLEDRVDRVVPAALLREAGHVV
jgi:hypothetical protein